MSGDGLLSIEVPRQRDMHYLRQEVVFLDLVGVCCFMASDCQLDSPVRFCVGMERGQYNIVHRQDRETRQS